ncbi:MAG: MFS transporter [Flavobacteriales bacterium]
MSITKGNKKTIRGWMMYDWANSVYNLVISSAVFPIFYEGVTKNEENVSYINGHKQYMVEAFGSEWVNTSLITFVGALGFLIVAFISPILSGVADYIGRKKMFMRIFVYLGSFSCMGLYFFDFEHIEIGFLFYILALIGFWGSLVFYNAFLPEIAEKKDHDRVSAGGFSMGYLGSVLLLIICLILVTFNNSFQFLGIADYQIDGVEYSGKGNASRLGFLLTGLWWFGFSHVFFFRIKETWEKYTVSSDILGNGFRELKSVYKEFMQDVNLKRFLPAFFMISTGVQTVMLVAVYFAAKEIQWAEESDKSSGLIISILLIQLIAIPGAMGMARVSKAIGNVKALQIIVFAWVCIVVWAYFIHTPVEFYFTAAMVGMVMGAVQSLSRSTYSKFLPPTEDTSSYFSFYDVTEKVAIVLGMFMFGFLEQWTGSMRNSIIAVGIFFVFGFILLSFVPKDKVKKA